MFQLTVGDRSLVRFSSCVTACSPVTAEVLRARARAYEDPFVQVPTVGAPLASAVASVITDQVLASAKEGLLDPQTSSALDPMYVIGTKALAKAMTYYASADMIQALAYYNIERMRPETYKTIVEAYQAGSGVGGAAMLSFEDFTAAYSELQRLKSTPVFSVVTPLSALSLSTSAMDLPLTGFRHPPPPAAGMRDALRDGRNGVRGIIASRSHLYGLRALSGLHAFYQNLGLAPSTRTEEANLAAANALRNLGSYLSWWAIMPRVMALAYYRALLRSPLIQEALLWNAQPSQVAALLTRVDADLARLDLLGWEKQFAYLWEKPRRSTFQGTPTDEFMLPADIMLSLQDELVDIPPSAVSQVGLSTYPVMPPLSQAGVDNHLVQLTLPRTWTAAGTLRRAFRDTSLACFAALQTAHSRIQDMTDEWAFCTAKLAQRQQEVSPLVRMLDGPDGYEAFAPSVADSGDHTPTIGSTGMASADPPRDAAAILERPWVPETLGAYTAGQVAVHAQIYGSDLRARLSLRTGEANPLFIMPVKISAAHANWFADLDIGPLRSLVPKAFSYEPGAITFTRLDRESIARITALAGGTVDATALYSALLAASETAAGRQALATHLASIGTLVMVSGDPTTDSKLIEQYMLGGDDLAIQPVQPNGTHTVRLGVSMTESVNRTLAFSRWMGAPAIAITYFARDDDATKGRLYFIAFGNIPAPVILDQSRVLLVAGAQPSARVSALGLAKAGLGAMLSPMGQRPVVGTPMEGPSVFGNSTDVHTDRWLESPGFMFNANLPALTTSWISVRAGYRFQHSHVLLLESPVDGVTRVSGAAPNDVLLMNDGTQRPRLAGWSPPATFKASDQVPDRQALAFMGLAMGDVRTVII